MSEIFNKLCKGPVVIVDDDVNKPGTEIVKFLEEIQKHHLPVLKYETPRTARKELKGLAFSNFVIFDWMFKKTSEEDILRGVQTGAAEKQTQEEENINFIKELQEVCLAPVFVISNMGKQEIEDILKREGILKDKNNFVFVQDKSELLNPAGKLVQQIEEWIKESPHVYLGKWWINEWLTKNNSVFWDLYQSAPNWPAIVYNAYKKDGDEPILGLIEMISQLIYTEIGTISIDEAYINREIKEEVGKSCRQLYERLMYTKNNIENDVKPGDIFKIDDEYFLNLRAECDTTKRLGNDDPDLYLIKGKVSSRKEVDISKKTGIIEKVWQIVFLLLDKNDIVLFDKRNFSIKKYSEIRNQKICRVVHPYITKIRQSFANYMGRFGIPAYPKELLDEIFSKKACSDDHQNK